MKLSFLLTALLTLTSCSSTQWAIEARPSEKTLEAVIADNKVTPDIWDLKLKNLTEFPIPKNVRPCCAFGTNHKVQFATLPIPLIRLSNTLTSKELGSHSYNAEYLTVSDNIQDGVSRREGNGLIYTRRGGVLDIAHIRDTADNTVSLFYVIHQRLGEQIEIKLPDELGPRSITVKAFDTSKLTARQKWNLSAAIAGKKAYQMAVSHEIAQWHGYRSFPLFSEEVSAYSPEDLYSNMLGARIAMALINSRLALTSSDYNKNMTIWLESAMKWLDEVDKKSTDAILMGMNGFWWDHSKRLPTKFLVRTRNYNLSNAQAPLLAKLKYLKKQDEWKEVKNLFDNLEEPVLLSLPKKVHGATIDELATLKLTIDEKYLKEFKHIPKSLINDLRDVRFQEVADKDKIVDQKQLPKLKK